jgi:hypothetical protein
MNVEQINRQQSGEMNRNRGAGLFDSALWPRICCGAGGLWIIIALACGGCAREDDDELGQIDESVTPSTETNETDSASDSSDTGDSETGSSAGGDTETTLTWETYVYDGSCEKAQTEAECQQASEMLPVITGIDDYWHSCQYFADFRTISRDIDGECTIGTEGRSFCQYQRGGEAADVSVPIDGCGVFPGWPGYIQTEDGLYFGLDDPKGLSYCQFTFDGTQMIAAPAECECLCDGQHFTIP